MSERENTRVKKTHITVSTGSYLTINWVLVQKKLGHGEVDNHELFTSIDLRTAGVDAKEYIRGIRDDLCEKLRFKGLKLKPDVLKTQEEVTYNGHTAYKLIAFSPAK